MTRRTLALAALAAAVTAGAAGATTQTAQAPPPAPAPRAPCVAPETTPSAATAAPSARLLDALAVLRRPRTAADALPAEALRHSFVDGVMTDATRHVRTQMGTDLWLVPVTDLSRTPPLPARCLRRLPAAERRATREAHERARAEPPVEGLAVATPRGLTGGHTVDTILSGQAFQIQGCTGTMHDRISVEGIVPDGVSQVTLTARDGAILQATPEQNTVRFDLARPDSAAGLPAHITSGTLEYAIDAMLTRGLDEPCEPPTRNSIGQRREPPTRLASPAGARIELQTTRWQPEDTGPQVAGATYRRAGRRCLLIAPERRLRAGGRAHRFCVDDRRLRAERFIARATRVAGGYVVLEGFVDRATVSAIVVERSLRPGAHRIATARGSGAFFMAVRGTFARGGRFRIHAALRGTPVRYTGLRDVRLKPRRAG